MKSKYIAALLCVVMGVFVLGSTSVAHAQRNKSVALVENGQARAAIRVAPEVMAADKTPDATLTPPQRDAWTQNETARRRLRESVKDLALYLEKMSGAKIEVLEAPASTQNDTRIPILIGSLAQSQFGAMKPTKSHRQGFRIAVTPKAIGLMGESDEATSYAIYEVLDHLGCRWFLPSEMGESIPSLKTVRLPIGERVSVPGTLFRGIWYADENFKRRNRLGGLAIQAGHALEVHSGDRYGYLTKKQLEDNPDWNAMIGGKRSINGRFCWGNPEVAVAVADSIIATLDANPAISLSLSPEDGATFCECPLDKALDAGDWDTSMNEMSITDRYINFCNRIAERVTKKHPDVLLGFLAYVQYTRPPVREKLHPNLVPMIAPITYCRAHAMTDTHMCPSRAQMKYIAEGWGKKAHQVSYYNYMFHLAEVAVPYPMMYQMKQELPILYNNKVVFWQPETMPNFESILPGMYLTLRKAWNPRYDSDAVLNEFFTRFYGAASEPMRKYWTHFDNAWAKVPEHAGSGFGYARRFSPQFMQQARAFMNEALAASNTDMVRSRVQMQNEALLQFEKFMQMRWDLNEGRLANLPTLADEYVARQKTLGEQYEPQSSFSKAYWAPETIGARYFNIFFANTFKDSGRIARDFNVISSPLRRWRYAVDKDKNGEAQNWQQAAFNDAAWKTTDVGIDTWFSLGLHAYYGPVWYRTTVDVPAVAAGKKVFLWVGSEDGDIKVFVNGQHVPYTNDKGEKLPEFKGGFGTPVSFDITSAVKPGAANQLTIVGTRVILNELGTGGLMSPVYLYTEK